MSFQTFKADLQKENLSMKRLEEVWEFYNLKNKSDLIDILANSLFEQLNKRKESRGSTSEDPVFFTPDEVSLMCDKFSNIIVRKSIKAQDPLLESLPLNITTGGKGWCWNPQTGIVFRPRRQDVLLQKKDNKSTDWVATRVLKSNKLYKLQFAHLVVCTTNGWYFETDDAVISSPFRVTGIPQ